MIVSPIIVAVVYPIPAIIIQCCMILGRLLYTIGYSMSGPKGRIIGALTMNLAILTSFGFIIATFVKLII